MVILRSRKKINDFLMILAWACAFNPFFTKVSDLIQDWSRFYSVLLTNQITVIDSVMCV